jgi:hypothetical protein
MLYSLESFVKGLDRHLDSYPDLGKLFVNSIDGTRSGILITFVGDNRVISMQFKPEGNADDI